MAHSYDNVGKQKTKEKKYNFEDDPYLKPLSLRPCSQTIVAWCFPLGLTTCVFPNSKLLLAVLLPANFEDIKKSHNSVTNVSFIDN